jgi:KipI family sensor histidine kinase inhibitor
VLIEYDLGLADIFELRLWLTKTIEQVNKQQFEPTSASSPGSQKQIQKQMPKVHRIPVCYEVLSDDDFAENETFTCDLSRLSELLALAESEIVEKHQTTQLTVFATGFLPNFAYLGSIAAEIECPRLAKPRAKVPGGAVAIADRQSAIYPVASAGGWNILGYSPIALNKIGFDVGDKVEFYAISAEEYRDHKTKNGQLQSAKKSLSIHKSAVLASLPTTDQQIPLSLTVENVGLYASLVDEGRTGLQHRGYCKAGPADIESMKLANCLLAKPAFSPAIEILMAGFTMTVDCDVYIAVTGARNQLLINSHTRALDTAHFCGAGSRISIFVPSTSCTASSTLSTSLQLSAAQGLYNYIAFDRFIDSSFMIDHSSSSELLLGSLCSVPREGLGGIRQDGSSLGSGDKLFFEPSMSSNSTKIPSLSRRQMLSATRHIQQLKARSTSNVVIPIRYVRAYQEDIFSSQHFALFESQTFTLTNEVSAMGMKLDGVALSIGEINMYSEGIACGAIQITPAGQPIVMMHQRQTIGGYPKLGSVISCDIPLLAQCCPGSMIQFVQSDLLTAHNLYQLQVSEI